MKDRVNQTCNGLVLIHSVEVTNTTTVVYNRHTPSCCYSENCLIKPPFIKTTLINTSLIIIGNTCRRLSNPIYGQVAVPSNSVGAFATYSCDPGHILVGQTTRECLQQGVWSGNQPICQRKSYVN